MAGGGLLFSGKPGKVGAFLSGLFMPPLCVHCRADRWSATPLCLACLRRVAALREPANMPSEAEGSAPEAGVSPLEAEGAVHGSLESLRFLFRMGPQLSTLIHGFKYRHMRRHIPFLCAYLRYRPDLRAWMRGFDALVPVPIHPVRRRERGYNQAEEIARELAPLSGMPVLPFALRRLRATVSQTKLGRRDRRGNLAGAFACAGPEAVKGKRILLLDDVFTTGATAECCAELLLAAGAVSVGAMALARVHAAADADDFALEMEAVSSYAS
jgi:ComF family protein